MAVSDAAKAVTTAATEPPPGADVSAATLSQKPASVSPAYVVAAGLTAR
jgi:hypothetical protein